MDNGLKKTTKKQLLVCGIILAAVALLIFAAYIGVNIFLNSINRIDPERSYADKKTSAVSGSGESEELDPIFAKADEIFAGNDVVNILLAGQDRRPWEEDVSQKTDAMILCTIDLDNKRITMTSFLRDLWVYIPNLYNQRLNMPYKLGGFPLLNDTLEYNFGVRADYNVEIDFAGFMESVDIIGGLELTLTAAEAEYLNKRGNWGVVGNINWTLREGKNLMSGSQVLAYTRISQLGTDFARTNRHCTVLTALIEKMEAVSSTELFDYSREILPLLSTDMNNNQMIELLLHMLPILADLEIKTQHIPISDQFTYEKKGEEDVLVMSREQLDRNKKLLSETMRGK